MLVRDLMDTGIVTLRRESTLAEIYAVMTQYRQSDFPVVDGDYRLVGMLYEEATLRPLFEEFKRSGGQIPDLAEFVQNFLGSFFFMRRIGKGPMKTSAFSRKNGARLFGIIANRNHIIKMLA